LFYFNNYTYHSYNYWNFNDSSHFDFCTTTLGSCSTIVNICNNNEFENETCQQTGNLYDCAGFYSDSEFTTDLEAMNLIVTFITFTIISIMRFINRCINKTIENKISFMLSIYAINIAGNYLLFSINLFTIVSFDNYSGQTIAIILFIKEFISFSSAIISLMKSYKSVIDSFEKISP